MMIEAFLREIDLRWPLGTGSTFPLQIIGSAALLLQADYHRGTKDNDVLESAVLQGEVKDKLEKLAGKDSRLHMRHRLYLDIVPNGLPFLPQQPVWHELASLNKHLRHFHVQVLDIVDVVVSKLKRFNANDRQDIDAMVDRELVDHARLVQRFEAAVDYFSMDARADDLPKYVANLHRVERDMLEVQETEIDLPSWV